MKRLILVIAAVGFTTAASAQDDRMDRLNSALGLEWFVANCQQGADMNPFLSVQANMIINGVTFTNIDDARSAVRDQIFKRWGDTENACVQLDNNFRSASASQRPAAEPQ